MAKRKAKKREEAVRLFAQRLRELRLSRGMTQAQLAGEAGVAVTYISELESAETSPGLDLMSRLAKALGTTVTDLLPAPDSPDSLPVLQEQARRLFDELLRTGNREALLVLNPLLALLVEASTKRR